MTRTTRPRHGFTLVELLVVIAIIGILLSITLVALQKTAEGQKSRRTKEQLYKLQQSLDAEYDRVLKKCASDATGKQIPQAVTDYCDGDPNRALAVWTALNLRRQFPDTFAEATSPFTLNGYTLQPLATFAEVGGLSGSPHDESAALLYIILAKKSVSGNSAMANAADDLSQATQKQIPFGATRLNTFTDGWDNTVGFRRWIQIPEVQNDTKYLGQPNQFNNANKDPLDPRNLVLGWADATKRGQMNTLLMFNGMNRMITVYAPATDRAPLTADDEFGFRLRQYTN